MRLPILLLFLAQTAPSPTAQLELEFMRQCAAERSQLECLRESLITFGKCVPLEDGALVIAKSERLQVTVSGDRWLRQGWGGRDSGAKDLGFLTEALSFLDFENRDPTAPSPSESILVAELGVMIDDFFAKLAQYGVVPEFLGDPTFTEKALPSGNWLKLASRCYSLAGREINCSYVGVVEGKDAVRGITGHSTGSLHPEIGAMIESIQLR